jgi:predicted Zn-dependent protease
MIIKRINRFSSIALAAILIGCATVPITGRKQLSLVPDSELLPMSFSQYQQLINESKLSTNQQEVKMVRTVGTRIADATNRFLKQNGMGDQVKKFQWEFNLIDADSIVNAFCMPGGKVAVYTGILPLTQNETGLAVVLGHEIAHAVANHGGERMSQGLVTELGGLGLSAALQSKPQQTQMLAMAAFGVGAQVGFLLPYSRLHESEADHIGLILMAMAGYDPREAVPFWERMSRLGGAAPPEFLSTHPSDRTRIENIQKELPEALKYYDAAKKR